MIFKVTSKESSRTYKIKADSVESAALKGAKKHLFGFFPVRVEEVTDPRFPLQWNAFNKAGESKRVTVEVWGDPSSESNDLYL